MTKTHWTQTTYKLKDGDTIFANGKATTMNLQAICRADLGFDVWSRIDEQGCLLIGPSGYNASEEQADAIGELAHRYGYTTIARCRKTLVLQPPQ